MVKQVVDTMTGMKINEFLDKIGYLVNGMTKLAIIIHSNEYKGKY